MATTHGTGVTNVRVRGLVPNISYEYQIVALSALGLASTAALINEVAFPDSVGPALPTAVTATPAANKTVHVTFAPSVSPDVAGYDWEIQRPVGTVFRHGSVATLRDQASITISLEEFEYNVTYYMLIWSFDYSGNYS